MANFKSVLLYLSSFTNEQKGSSFELYCKWYLENDPGYKSKLRRVWLWHDWPKRWGRDKGIDLIAETKRGEVWAIQAKAYDEAHSITKQDIDTFLSESSRSKISHRLLIATTDKLAKNAREVINGQEKKVSIRLLYQLQDAELDWPESIEALYPTAPLKPKEPRPHQQEAIQHILDGFKSSSIGQVHMACGTGKTLVGLWVAKELQCKNVLVLVPSISLVSQLHKEWVANSGEFSFDPIFVCSDPTVAYDKDQMVAHLAELGYPVTTNAQELCKQMKQSDEYNVVFATYHSSSVIAEACSLDASLSFDLAIADEAHRCAGPKSSEFTTIVDTDAIRADRKLFMTATPKYFTDRVKKVTQENDLEIVSMDDEHKFGPVFYSLPFSAAIKQDLLSDYQVIIAVMDNATYQEYAERGRFVNIDGHETDARTIASQILVAKTIKKHGLKKVISFHSRKKSAKEFIDSFNEVNSFLPDDERPEVGFHETIFGEMPQEKRHTIMQQFKEATEHHAGIIGNVKCLSEGVDVPAIDGIAFIDPKGSEIDIIQSVGRVIRKSADKRIGTIIIPIFTDGDGDDEELLSKSCFKSVWQVIKALRAQDDTLAEELDNIRLERGSRKHKKRAILSKLVIDVHAKINTNKFCAAVKTKAVELCGIVSLAKSHPELAKQWHSTKNGNLKPEDVTAGSGRKVWWICEKGHEWQAPTYSRVVCRGCSYCSGRKATIENNLTITHPEIAAQWHPNKNGDLTPNEVTAGSNKRVWWICKQKHEWRAAICKRTIGRGCHYCCNQKANAESCLATSHPELSKQWHPTRNGSLTPNDVTAGSKRKVWWLCEKKHDWQAATVKRARGNGCPYCSNRKVSVENSIAMTHPELAAQWHSTKNGNLRPEDVTAGSGRKIWWICEKGHEWQAPTYSRVVCRGCSYCSGRKATIENNLTITHPEIAAQWHPNKNGDLTPNEVTAGSNKRVWWICKQKHEWRAAICKRTIGRGCHYCCNQKANAESCLATSHPELSKQWHPTRNGSLTPNDVTAGSSKRKVLWLCEKGHEWQAAIYDRVRGRGCPHCYKDKRKKGGGAKKL